MALISFSPNTKIKSADINANLTGLANGTNDVDANNLALTRRLSLPNFVAGSTPGLTMATSANLTTNLIQGIAFVNGKYLFIPTTPVTVQASKDTYLDIKDDGTIVQVPVANGATTGMTLTTNSDGSPAFRVAGITSSASAITSVNQGAFPDPLGNRIYNRSTIITANEEPWRTPSLSSGWSGYDSGGAGMFGSPQYFKDSMGMVHFKGLIKNTSGATFNSGSVMFVLPVGYRPSQNIINTTDASDNFCRVDVTANGQVSINGTSSLINGGWLSLNNIHFRAEG